ncbi:hypothetical protein [Sanyastnella coralliicola]|uniref:hypothetical protein n=1 Tax=Sanyastnella coralliicola TaxID=3069118 RepID=UPI0027BACEEE|nr:hypothetical protein [Longitalea sp. SCSIO 12813]
MKINAALRLKALFLLLLFASELFYPTAALALTSGPSQPEFSSFEPVSSSDMVNPFTGDFSYNLPVLQIPGPNGGGYALSLSYHSGVQPEEEASWVGLGWTLNPGAINRSKRGFPDDWKGESVTYHNKRPANKTTSATISGPIETFGIDLSVSGNASVRYNNYTGYGFSSGLSFTSDKGLSSIGVQFSEGQASFSGSVNPGRIAHTRYKSSQASSEKEESIASAKISSWIKEGSKKSTLTVAGSQYGVYSHNYSTRSEKIHGYEGTSTNVTFQGVGTLTPLPIGSSASISGAFTKQEYTEVDEKNVYGYMYSGDVSNSEDIQDYYVEKENTYNRNDKSIGVPFSNPDAFVVSGEGIGGGFRMYNSRVGTFRPNKKSNHTDIYNIAFEGNVGSNNGVGTQLGTGDHDLTVEGWQTGGYQFASADDPEGVFMRFNSDLGGELTYASNNPETPYAAVLNEGEMIPGIKEYNLGGVPNILQELGGGERVGQSSFVTYTTNEEILETIDDLNGDALSPTTRYKAYTKKDNISNAAIARSTVPDQVGEIAVVNESGIQYVYGLPVYARNEKDLQYSLVEGYSVPDLGLNSGEVNNIFMNNPEEAEVKMGEERDTPYATSYLLTQITTSDYLDMTMNGPTDDDLGGWTKFKYKRIAGGLDQDSDEWYKWRAPYKGYIYNRNSLSDPKDDICSVSEGEKEIYYLERIETKTHVALFITSDRKDGFEAIDNAGQGVQGYGEDGLLKLDRIELFVKNQDGSIGERLKTVRFEYHEEYNDSAGLTGLSPNVWNGQSETGNNPAKLTLKRVWFENENIYNAKIAPYEFDYAYPQNPNYPESGPGEAYEEIADFYNDYTLGMQNPDYNPYNIDAWGNYQFDGAERLKKDMNWVDQNPAPFDPAAWNLKQIHLPSGGEIHVQYEADDYCYVQDQRAHAMVSLHPSSIETPIPDEIFSGSQYFLDLESTLGWTWDTHADEISEMVDLINAEYLGGKKIYFKFLYRLLGEGAPPELEDCNAEYISGYAKLASATLTDPSEGNVRIRITLSSEEDHLPKRLCRDFYKTQRRGLVSDNGEVCDPVSGEFDDEGPSAVQSLVQALSTMTFAAEACLEINDELSYFRVPLPVAKKGGGVRVKRLLMYDPDTPQEDGVSYTSLYGSEYIYKDINPISGDWESSGVATNEPPSIREENPLTNVLDEFEQSFIDKVVGGVDKDYNEGPLGESIMPGAAVGYSTVIVKNIHEGPTGSGYNIQRYYTAKDYPFQYDMTNLDLTKKDYLPLPLGMLNYFTNNQWLTQGFSFVKNNMHGQMRSMTTYAEACGDFSLAPPTEGAPGAFDTGRITSQQEIEYFEPGEAIPIWKGFNFEGYVENDYGTFDNIEMQYPGREVDVIMESKQIRDITNDVSVEADISFGTPLIPFATVVPELTYKESELYLHKTTKVIQYPVIAKKSTTFTEGVYHVTENVGFDELTGRTIVSRTTDGFVGKTMPDGTPAGTYTSYSIPAHFEYNATKQKSIAEGKFIVAATEGVTISKTVDEEGAILQFFDDADVAGTPDLCALMDNFNSGDLLVVGDMIFNTISVDGNTLHISPSFVHNGVNGSSIPDLAGIEILRSGRSNQIAMGIGNVTTYGEAKLNSFPNAEVAARQGLADLLNASLPLIPNEGDKTTISTSQVSSYDLISPFNGTCGPLSEYEMTVGVDQFTIPEDIHLERLADRIRISVGGLEDQWLSTEICGDNENRALSVQHLNNALPQLWNFTSAGLSVYESTSFHIDFPGVGDVLVFPYSFVTTDEDGYFASMNAAFAAQAAVDFSDCTYEIIPNITFFPLGQINGVSRVIYVKPEGQTEYQLRSLRGAYGGEVIVQMAQYIGPNPSGSEVGYVESYSPSCIQNFEATPSSDQEMIGDYGQSEEGYITLTPSHSSCDFQVFESNVMIERSPQTIQPACYHDIALSGTSGEFAIDQETGLLIYTDGGMCFDQEISCPQFCNTEFGGKGITNVVSCSATTISDNWNPELNPLAADYSYNEVELGKKGKWRGHGTYAYNTDAVASLEEDFNPATAESRNYNTGLFDMNYFVWGEGEGEGSQGPWLNLSNLTNYSSQGQAVEERNILGIEGVTKFGYHENLPVLSAQNANENNTIFCSYEMLYGTEHLENGIKTNPQLERSNFKSHTGEYSARLINSSQGAFISNMFMDDHIGQEGLLAKVWVSSDVVDDLVLADNFKMILRPEGSTTLQAGEYGFKKVARSGEWVLLEAYLPPLENIGLSSFDIYLYMNYGNTGATSCFIDDLRIQPRDGAMTTYVYDPVNYRLLASMDDQNFALLYQYNAEGKLIRQLKETERGTKTLQESHYNTPKVAR